MIPMNYEITIQGKRRIVELISRGDENSRVILDVDGRRLEADAVRISRGAYSILFAGKSFEISVEEIPDGLLVRANGLDYQAQIRDPRSWKRGRGQGIELEGRQKLTAPMPGKVVRTLAAVGENVQAGQPLLVIEAMKMQNEIRSPKSGKVETLAREGQTVNAGEVLAVIA
jgi:biotin carboxyl carrier protein